MKNVKSLIAIAIFVIASNVGYAIPTFFYSNVAINNTGQLIPSASINVEISLFQNNTLVYKEMHNGVPTSAFSFFNVEVGTGTPLAPFSLNDMTAIISNVTLKTQARIEIGAGNWVSLGSAYTTSILHSRFTGNPAEIDLPAGMILIGDASNNASAVTLSNDASINSTGALTISDDAITTSKIFDGSVTYSKIQSASNQNLMLISNSANNWIETQVSAVGVNLLNLANGNANQYLTSNGDGTVQWSNGSNGQTQGWSLTGNAGTIEGTTNYIGTTDNVALNFKVNNQQSGRIGTSADGSVFLGYLAGANDDLSNNQNVFIGYQSGTSNTTGSFNTANGYQSLYSNTTGISNTANGSYALYYNTTGSYNTANGASALYYNTTGEDNTANGFGSLFSNTEGYRNTANGSVALYSNTTGYSNTAIGASALFSNSTAQANTAVGANALMNNTQGYQNAAVGYSSLVSNTTGFNNSALGTQSLQQNTEGIYNTANGVSALALNTTGSYNAGFGTSALHTNVTGNDNTAVGDNAGPNGTDYNNTTAIGAYSVTTASNQVRIGDANVTSIGGYAGWTNLSDGRFKMNVNENVPGLEFVMKLRPVTYNVDVNQLDNFLGVQRRASSSNEIPESQTLIHTGFIAQEVEAAASSIGFDFSGIDFPKNENDYYGLRYGEFVVPLTKAIQEQQALIEAQQQLIEQLLQQSELYSEQIEELQYQMKLIKMQFKSAKK